MLKYLQAESIIKEESEGSIRMILLRVSDQNGSLRYPSLTAELIQNIKKGLT